MLDPGVCNEAHATVFAKRKERSLTDILASLGAEGFFRPTKVDVHHDAHWLRLKEPDGHVCDSIAITAAKAGSLPTLKAFH
jgi:hypothetical protein